MTVVWFTLGVAAGLVIAALVVWFVFFKGDGGIRLPW